MFEGIDCSRSKQLQAQPQSGCLRPERERLLARVYPSASADPNLTFHYDPSTGAFQLQASGQLGDVPTVVVFPVEVTGAVTVSGVLAGELAFSLQGIGVRLAMGYPWEADTASRVAAEWLWQTRC